MHYVTSVSVEWFVSSKSALMMIAAKKLMNIEAHELRDIEAVVRKKYCIDPSLIINENKVSISCKI
ncbi:MULTISPECIES: hypothetical protein [Enterobacteriaceae]|uniref:hypothetical protein n=1 Tax=Enterobacteriaceae TaxID=543 RepID=UPI002A364E9E|nr:hypothetical protein [Enterobacter sp. 170198]